MLLVIIAFANISLPLTNAFVGEFMMFNGIWASTITKYNIVFTALAALSIILGAVYTLRMVQQVFYGSTNRITATGHDIYANEKTVLSVLVLLIVVLGVYPQPLLNLTNGFTDNLLQAINLTHQSIK
jgi:NADH-quinone oxidoreductase subunit M